MIALVPIEAFTRWLDVGERGASSETIVRKLTGIPVGSSRWGDDHPHDPADFRRCELLLRQCPAAREAFPAMAEVSPIWARFVAEWDRLAALLVGEVPGVFDAGPLGSAPLTYQAIRAVIDGGDAA